MDRDRFMSAEEAQSYGIIDTVFNPRKEIVATGGNGQKALTPS
jgi:ATP-dependent protease ClpP protease subunit